MCWSYVLIWSGQIKVNLPLLLDMWSANVVETDRNTSELCGNCCFIKEDCLKLLSWGSRGLMVESQTHNWKVASSSLGPAGIVGGGNECTVLSPSSIPRLRCPWARHRTSPGRHSINGCPLLRVCVHCCVVALGWVNAEHEFQILVTILGCMSLSLTFFFLKMVLMVLKCSIEIQECHSIICSALEGFPKKQSCQCLEFRF